ncbi:MAG: DegT/DnrJ/EryC1/StrS aminotransferase family protein [Acidobacteria bacterium]|nr:DegT/DnrJ/EryC1/StrS aminotransferase family protein [Acidobacteriota bacterium]
MPSSAARRSTPPGFPSPGPWFHPWTVSSTTAAACWHRQQLYRPYYRPAEDPLEVTERLSRGVLSLPLYPQMSENDIARIARRVLDIRDWALDATPAQRASLAAARSAR